MQMTGAPGPAIAGAGGTTRVQPERLPAFNCPLAFSPDGWLLAIIHKSDGYRAEVYDVAAGKRLSEYRSAVRALAFSPDGKTLATSGILSVVLIDPITGEEKATLPRPPRSQ